MMFILNAVALFVVGTLVGNEIAIAAFVHPALYKLDDHAHQAAARAVAQVLGLAAPVWYAVAGALLIAVAAVTTVPLVILAAFIWICVIAWTILKLAPLNKQIASWTLTNPPAEWREQRLRWDRWHRVRVVALSVSFALLCLVVATFPHASR